MLRWGVTFYTVLIAKAHHTWWYHLKIETKSGYIMKSITSFTNLDAGGQHFWQERVVKITSYTIKLNIYNLWFHPLSNWSGIFLYSAASHEDICGRKLGRGMSDLVKSVWNFSVPFDTQSQGWIYWEVWLAGGWLCNFMQTHSEPPKMEQNWKTNAMDFLRAAQQIWHLQFQFLSGLGGNFVQLTVAHSFSAVQSKEVSVSHRCISGIGNQHFGLFALWRLSSPLFRVSVIGGYTVTNTARLRTIITTFAFQ